MLMLAATACAPGRRAAPTPTKPAASEPGPAPDVLCGGASGRACQLKLFALQPDDGVASLTARLDRATASIDYSPFLLDQPDIVRSLVNAQRRGVRVRLLTEPRNDKENGSALKALRAAGVQLRPANPAFAMTHAKYIVVDGSRVLLLTFNSSEKELTTRRDFALEDDDQDDVRFMQSLFEADWDRSAIGPIPPGMALSPDNADEVLPALMRSASQSIDLYAEKLESSPLMSAMVDAARRGVTVRIVATPPDKKVPGPLADAIRRRQIEVRVPRDLGIHAKMMLVDGATVYLGSENVEDAVGERRRELGVIFGDAAVAGRLREVFEGDWARPADRLE
jgi:phosphatidylserine/phosphatidylglycerophosphate/cardiolipin synthase-like enzyme